jgi:type IX secretion system PorP/SprF family membrane protein
MFGLHKILTLTILFFLGTYFFALKAQDIAFSQYYYTPFLTNIASFSQNQDARVAFQFRHQPLASGESFSSPIFSIQYPFLTKKTPAFSRMSIGLAISQDNLANLLKTTGIELGTAYQWKWGNELLSLGFKGSYFQRNMDIANITTDAQFLAGYFDPNMDLNDDFSNQQTGYFSVGTGLFGHHLNPFDRNKYFWGLSFHNLNRPDISFVGNDTYRMPLISTLVAGVDVLNNRSFSIIPNARWIRRLDKDYINAGTWLQYHSFPNDKPFKISLGTWYQSNGAWVMSAEVENHNYLLVFSYDIPTSDEAFNWLGNGSTEITFALKLSGKHKKKPVYIPIIEPIEDYRTSLKIDSTQKWRVYTHPSIKIDTLPAHKRPIKDTISVARIIQEEGFVSAKQQLDWLKKILKKEYPPLKQGTELMSMSIPFEFNSNRFTEQYNDFLTDLAQLLKQHPRLKLNIIGHTCNIGTSEGNQQLSEKRSESIKQFMITKGVNLQNIKSEGKGMYQPLLPNIHEDNRKRNRRVEFKVVVGEKD